MTLAETAYFWVGTNANLFFLSVGVVAFELGLSVAEALVAVVLGTSLFALVGIASIAGVRAGLPTLTFTRAVFGPRGNVPHGVLTWVALVAFEALNSIFAVYALLALLAELGWRSTGDLEKVVATLLVLAASGGIAVFGHATMIYVQRLFAVALTVVLALVLAYSAGGVDWSAHASAGGWTAVALVLTGAAVVASGPISYLFNAPDFVRYLPSRTPSRAIAWTVILSSGLVPLFLSAMGVVLASRGDMSDPIAGVEPFVPGWLFVLYILAAVGGSITNNVAVYYSSGLVLQAIGVPLRRSVATVVHTVASVAIVLYVLFSEDFLTVLHDFVALLVVWLAPFGAVWITDALLRGWRYEPAGVHDVSPSGPYWGRGGVGVRAWIALLLGVGVCLLTIDAPILEGPVSHALGGADLTWVLGPLTSALAYWALTAGRAP